MSRFFSDSALSLALDLVLDTEQLLLKPFFDLTNNQGSEAFRKF